MPFDPTQPQPGDALDADLIRAQLTALNDKIDALTARVTATETGLGGTARNPSLGTLNLSLDDPPTRPQVQAFLDDFNALLNQITRV